MDRESFVEQVKIHFQWLIELGYQFNQIERNIYFEKESISESFKIGFSWSEYNRFLIQGISCAKRFKSVENVINEKTGNLDYTIRLQRQGSVPIEFEAIKDETHFVNSFFISDNSQMPLFSQMVRDFYDKEVKLFYDEFKTIGSVLNWLSKADMQKHSDLLVVNNNSMMLRKLIIMKEGKSEEFEDLYSRYKEFLRQKYTEKESPYIEQYAEFKEFDDYFDNHPA